MAHRGVCMAGGICGRGGACLVGGHAWPRGACMVDGGMCTAETATEAGGTHPTGMHSC